MIKNKILRTVLVLYIIVLTCVYLLACSYSYQNRYNSHLVKINDAMQQVASAYEHDTDHFWRYYQPLFTDQFHAREILTRYFSRPPESELIPGEKQELMKALSYLSAYSDSLRWILLYSPDHEINYIYYVEYGIVEEVPEDFPFNHPPLPQEHQMQILGNQKITYQPKSYSPYVERNYAVMGGGPDILSHDKMIFGFSVSKMQKIAASFPDTFQSVEFHIVEDGQVVYTSSPSGKPPFIPENREITQARDENERKILVYSLDETPRNSICYFTIDKKELSGICFKEIAHLIVVMVISLGISVLLFIMLIINMNKELSAIQRGLHKLGSNELDYRFNLHFNNDGFNEIAQAINSMAEELQRNVEKSYQFEIKQKEQEMAELLAKFNPHFLYNTLELFRVRCMENGDDRTAELIEHAATLFRSLISTQYIVTLQQELAFTEHYLKLFRARYGEQMQILYDFDSEVLECMVVRNILQPLIENYFEHGFMTAKWDNELKISGEKIDCDKLKITVRDNGKGIDEETYQKLLKRVFTTEESHSESYGLKNLHQRIRLYYGEGYGLTITRNPDHGLTVSMLLPLIKQS